MSIAEAVGMLGPVQFIDNVVKGLVLVVYDFVQISIVGIMVPFINRSRRIWPWAFSVSKRLSSLTYLILWVTASVGVALGDPSRLAWEAAGYAAKPTGYLPAVAITVLIISIIVDLQVRLAVWLLPGRIKQRVYETVFRICFANGFLGSCLLMLMWPRDPENLENVMPATGVIWYSELLKIRYPNPAVILFLWPLLIVVVKAFAVTTIQRRVLTGCIILFAVLTIIANTSIPVYWAAVRGIVNLTGSAIAKPSIYQRYTECIVTGNEIRVSSWVTLEGRKSIPVRPTDFAVYNSAEAEVYVGKVVHGQSGILLTNSEYTHIEFTATYEPNDATNAKKAKGPTDGKSGKMGCELKLVNNPFGWGENSRVIVQGEKEDHD
jgi:hypothetical protein